VALELEATSASPILPTGAPETYRTAVDALFRG